MMSKSFFKTLEHFVIAAFAAFLLIGGAESFYLKGILGQGEQNSWLSVLSYTWLLYPLIGAGIAALAAIAWQLSLGRTRTAPRMLTLCFAMFALMALPMGLFFAKRDLFQEKLSWASAQGLITLLSALATTAVVFFVLRAIAIRFAHTSLAGSLRQKALLIAPGISILCLIGFLATRQNAEDAAEEQSSVHPNVQGSVLLIVVDTLRADKLPAYGYPQGKTPNLDGFVRESVLFKKAFANASWTRPSFATILTGRFAASHRTMGKSDALPKNLTTIAEAFQAGGYTTHGIVTNYNLAPTFAFDQGFDGYQYLEPEFVLGANDATAKLFFVQILRRGIERVRAITHNTPRGSAYQDAEVVNQRFFEALDTIGSKPFFFLLGYMDPHDPYYAHPFNGHAYSRAAHPNPSLKEAEALKKLYDSEITYWDENFGELIGKLKAQGLYDDLTIIVTSDHGEEFGDHGGFWHGTTLYDEQLHIPLLVKLPKNHLAGTTVEHWVQHIDIMPTLLKLSKVSVPAGVQGSDLFAPGTTETYAEEDHEGNVLRAYRTQKNNSEIKVIEANANNPRGLKAIELYKLNQDPLEKNNLSDSAKGEAVALSGELKTFAKNASSGAARKAQVNIANDEEAVERLRALGYTDK